MYLELRVLTLGQGVEDGGGGGAGDWREGPCML